MEENEKTLENAYLPYWTGMGYAVGKTAGGSLSDFKEAEITVNLPPHSTTSHGRLITENAAAVMISKSKENFNAGAKNLAYKNFDDNDFQNFMNVIFESLLAPKTTFSKEVLLFLLAQTGCEGIKFHYCVNHELKRSLVLIGVDAKGNEIGMNGAKIENTNPVSDFDVFDKVLGGTKPAIVEVGGTDG